MFSSDESTREWGCSKCKGEEFEDGDKYREFRNCDNDKNENIAWDWMPSLRRCPWSQIDTDALEAVGWWAEYKEFGALPWGGSDLMEQPAFVLQIFTFCTDLKNKIESEHVRKERAKWQKNAKSGSR